MSPFLFFLLLIGMTSNSDAITQKMVVVWGQPESLSRCVPHADLIWNLCMEICFKTESCVMTFLDNTETCYTCAFNESMSSVQQTRKEDKMKVAFKVGENLVDKCPAGENPPTFDGVMAEGDASTTTDDGKIQNYTISYTGTGWEFSVFSMKRCTSGYAFYRRPNIDWCIAVGYTSYANTSYSRTSNVCQQYGTELSGVASADEVEGLVYQLNALRERLNVTSFNVFADAQRTTECQETPTTEKCMSIDGFKTVDKSVQNLDAYHFMTDASAGATIGKQCMVMLGNVRNDGKVDFVECESDFPFPIWGAICGHEAFS
ncbi:hypothetical protein GCK72_012540 [Caenorhabditis remanei]|uniref:PAN-3 domain-containing protein n=1 Tax=Caenorhabditis remanei TaxID=31234 RepID=A0A6A5GL72_CAERE|nr:hypothetical protein GCK72_012540 [Caenorhabditis remanei]KAF1756087.1 hypothetical protein GCK72_012540 [Caenorhabditis remanei]